MKDKDKTKDEVKEQEEKEPQEAKEAAPADPETSDSSDAEEEEKAILEDVEELQKKLEESTAKSEEYLDRLRRTMAEFDNFRKRTQKEKEQIFDRGAKDVLEQILPVIDNFERALAGSDKKDDSFAKGVEMIYKQLLGALESLGLQEIEACGKPFDPNYHNAVTHVEDESAGENEVVEVFQKGYKYKDAVIRCSMVKVAN